MLSHQTVEDSSWPELPIIRLSASGQHRLLQATGLTRATSPSSTH